MKGAERNVIDKYGRRPIDIAHECKVQNVKKELISFLVSSNLSDDFDIGRAKLNAEVHDLNTFEESSKIICLCDDIHSPLHYKFSISKIFCLSK